MLAVPSTAALLAQTSGRSLRFCRTS